MSQNHFTLSFPLKSPADAKAIAEELPPLMPALFRAEDGIGTIHYSRFAILSEKTLLFLGDFDGEFGQLMTDLAVHAGRVFDAIFQHVTDPPGTPVASNPPAFVEWAAEHVLHALNLYTAYPGVTVQEIKAMAAAADVAGAGELNPFLVVLPTKSRLAFYETATTPQGAGARDYQEIWTRSARLISPSSFHWRTTRLVSLPSTMATSTSTLPISPRTSERSSICYSNSPRVHRRRRAESTSRNSLTSPLARTGLPSGSTRRIRGCRYRTSRRSSRIANHERGLINPEVE